LAGTIFDFSGNATTMANLLCNLTVVLALIGLVKRRGIRLLWRQAE